MLEITLESWDSARINGARNIFEADSDKKVLWTVSYLGLAVTRQASSDV